MTPEQKDIFERLSATTQERLIRVARRIADGYVGDIVVHVKGGQGRSGISRIQWTQTDTFRDE